jgi:carboxyl-terminal processing protease
MGAGVVMAKRLPAQAGVYEQLKVFTEALSYVESNYVDEVESAKVIQGAIRGMLKALTPTLPLCHPRCIVRCRSKLKGVLAA